MLFSYKNIRKKQIFSWERYGVDVNSVSSCFFHTAISFWLSLVFSVWQKWRIDYIFKEGVVESQLVELGVGRDLFWGDIYWQYDQYDLMVISGFLEPVSMEAGQPG